MLVTQRQKHILSLHKKENANISILIHELYQLKTGSFHKIVTPTLLSEIITLQVG